MVGIKSGCAMVLAAASVAAAQQQVAINLTGLQIKNALNQSKSSAPNTISQAYRYHFVVDGMVHGTGLFSVLSTMFPTPTPLATVMETLSPGSSAFLTGDFDNCSGMLPVNPPAQTSAGTQVISGITVTYAMTMGFQIDASAAGGTAGVASFNLTNVVLTPALLVGGLQFDSGTATLTRVYVCPPNCDGSTSTPVLNVADFTCFLQKFAAADPTANCDCSTATPALNVADFTCFLQQFAGGCPAP
jgi:hypothetical protein